MEQQEYTQLNTNDTYERINWLISHPYISAVFNNSLPNITSNKDMRSLLRVFVDEINDFYEASGDKRLTFGELRYLLRHLRFIKKKSYNNVVAISSCP